MNNFHLLKAFFQNLFHYLYLILYKDLLNIVLQINFHHSKLNIFIISFFLIISLINEFLAILIFF